jgi:Tn3 transposase DDE domain
MTMPARDFRGYGPTPPNPRWPGEARIAINIDLNFEAGGERSMLEGDGTSENMLTDTGAWRKPHPMSANDRLVGRVRFTSGQRLTGRRKQRRAFSPSARRLVGSALIVTPLESEVPDAAEALKWELNSFLPNVHITDLLAEVDGWTGFTDKFTHLRIGGMVRNRSAILAAVLADATNLGPKRG